MRNTYGCAVLALCLCLGISQPVQNGPVLKPSPSEVLFRVGDNTRPLVLECAAEGESANLKYSWNKNGKPLEISGPIQFSNIQTEGTILFLQPKQDDEGEYQCLVESDAGVASTRVIKVKRTYIDIPKESLKVHKPVEGRPFKLNCVIPDSYPKPEISWMYQFITDSSISHSVLDKRITQSPDGNLWFSNVTKEDTHENFKYVCVGKTPAVDEDVVLAEHVIEDVMPDNSPNDGRLVEQYTSGDMVAKVGDVSMIYCIYGGTPLAHPDWYKDGKNVNNQPKDRVTRYNRSAGKRLLIRETWLEDEGIYTCLVDNEVGEPQSHSMCLTVVSAPEFTKQPQPRSMSKAGQEVTIPCEVAGVPNAAVTWTYNAKPLQPNDSIQIRQDKSGNLTAANLIIKNVQANDSGYYGCRGINENGDIYAETLLYVSEI